MANEFIQHPEGLVIIRTDSGTYMDIPENFKNDFGISVPTLPEGITERYYIQNTCHALKAGANVVDGGPISWRFADDLFGAVDDALKLKNTRDEKIKFEKHQKHLDEGNEKIKAQEEINLKTRDAVNKKTKEEFEAMNDTKNKGSMENLQKAAEDNKLIASIVVRIQEELKNKKKTGNG